MMTEEQARAILDMIISEIEQEVRSISGVQTLTRQERARFDEGHKLTLAVGEKAVRDTELQFLKALELDMKIYTQAKERGNHGVASLYLFQMGDSYGRLQAYRAATSESHRQLLANLCANAHRSKRVADGQPSDHDIVHREALVAFDRKPTASKNEIAKRLSKSWEALGLSRYFSPRTIRRWIDESLTYPKGKLS